MFHPIRRVKRTARKVKRSINTTTRKVTTVAVLLGGTSSPLAAAQVAPNTGLGEFGNSLISLVASEIKQ